MIGEGKIGKVAGFSAALTCWPIGREDWSIEAVYFEIEIPRKRTNRGGINWIVDVLDVVVNSRFLIS
jgi:hypothetical protein